MKSTSVKSKCRQCVSRFIGGALIVAFCAGANAWTIKSDSSTLAIQTLVVQPATNLPVAAVPAANPPVTNQAPPLDEKRLYALGMIETGNNDWEVGAAGEISRYQIDPNIWKTYSAKSDYRDPEAAMRVARQHWAWLAGYFHDKTGRQPTDFDMYVMWNTKYGYYAKRGFVPEKLSANVRNRAQRFVNLVNRKG